MSMKKNLGTFRNGTRNVRIYNDSEYFVVETYDGWRCMGSSAFRQYSQALDCRDKFLNGKQN